MQVCFLVLSLMVAVFCFSYSLISNGCREKDIAEAVRKSRNIRHARERSMSNKSWDPVHEVAEKALRKVTKKFRGNEGMTMEPAAMTMESVRQKKLDQAPEQVLPEVVVA